MKKMTKLIYIASAHHSGSTLLDVILASQPGVFGLGEVHRLSMPLQQRVSSFGNRCACRAQIQNCVFWSAIAKQFGDQFDWEVGLPIALSSHDAERYKRGRVNQLLTLLATPQTAKLFCFISRRFKREYQAAQQSWRLFDTISKQTGSQYLVDSSKSPGRMKMLYLVRPHAINIVRLTRDGRGVVNSLSRQELSFEKACHFWFQQNNALQKTLWTMPKAAVLRISYEQYCDHMHDTITQLADFLNIDKPLFEIDLANVNCHQIPGNIMLHHNRQVIRKDEKWKQNWNKQKEAMFADICGDLNTRLGYKRFF